MDSTQSRLASGGAKPRGACRPLGAGQNGPTHACPVNRERSAQEREGLERRPALPYAIMRRVLLGYRAGPVPQSYHAMTLKGEL